MSFGNTVCVLYGSQSKQQLRTENEVGRAYSTYMSENSCIQRFWWRNLKEGDHLEDPGDRWEGNIEMDV